MTFRIDALHFITEDYGNEPDDFFIQAHGEIVSDDDPGGEAMVVNLVSPKRIARLVTAEKAVAGRGLVIVDEPDSSRVIAFVQRIVDAADAESWDELAEHMKSHFDWV